LRSKRLPEGPKPFINTSKGWKGMSETKPWHDWDQWNPSPFPSTAGYSTNTAPTEPDKPVTIDTILADIKVMQEFQRRHGMKPLEPVEVTEEQWEMLKQRLPVRGDPWMFAMGVPVVVKP
jgi:hypothetical protein